MSEMNASRTMKDVYALIAELWCSPPGEDAEREKAGRKAEKVVKRLARIDKESA
ncbi:hypothetical protein LCGC14_2955210, partial [marine sediment metagenome]